MRLRKDQKELALKWIAEGLRSDEMNKRAAKCADPFEISRQQVEYYRRTRSQDISEITKQEEFQALNTGLALASVRVEKLKQLAELMEKDLIRGGLLWLDRIKSVGGGNNFSQFTEQEFNRAEVESYRGVLDDIAKELGHRVQKSEVIGDADGEIHVTIHNPYHTDEVKGGGMLTLTNDN